MNLRPKTTLAALFVLVLSGQGCASCGQKMLGTIDGAINDPSNFGLRRKILAWGLSEFCSEMTTHSAPLMLTPGTPSIGRFFPDTCVQRELGNGDLLVEFSGRGYGWTNVSKKMVFNAGAQVHYDQDFQLDGSTAYVYFRTKQAQNSQFRIGVVEQPVASFFASLTPLGDQIGRQLLSGKIGEGFTVIREPNGSADFSLGIVPKGQRPQHAFDVHGEDRVTYENNRSEVHQNQRDFVGPIKVEGSGRALYVTATLDGLPAVDVLVMRGGEGRASLDLYLNYAQSGPLAAPPMFADFVQAGVPYKRAVPVPEGLYYVVFDNTPTAGQTMPPVNLFDDRAALLNYVVQIGDEP